MTLFSLNQNNLKTLICIMTEKHPTVLLVENDHELSSSLKEYLESKNYRVDLESRGDRALKLFQAEKYDIIVVNVALPVLSGMELTKEIRKTDYTTPLLMISDLGDDREKIMAFCSGGDDYIEKPFSRTELALRIYALLKRTKPSLVQNEEIEMVRFGNFTFDYPNRMLCTPTENINLTKKEAEVLRMLATNINNVVKREKVLTTVWGANDYFMGRSMDVYIARLRKKLSEDQAVNIVNIHRMGFKLEVNGTMVS
ncbi:MAG TPA: response regulator transcription factor [Bacteroides sp.]|nr:response regulator transcription factor [Bacteroides sp.]